MFSVSIYPLPSLSGLIGLGDGSVEFTITGIPGRKYDVQHSEDLKTWVLLEQVTLQSTSATVTDLNSPGEVRRFYRMDWTP